MKIRLGIKSIISCFVPKRFVTKQVGKESSQIKTAMLEGDSEYFPKFEDVRKEMGTAPNPLFKKVKGISQAEEYIDKEADDFLKQEI